MKYLLTTWYEKKLYKQPLGWICFYDIVAVEKQTEKAVLCNVEISGGNIGQVAYELETNGELYKQVIKKWMPKSAFAFADFEGFQKKDEKEIKKYLRTVTGEDYKEYRRQIRELLK